VRPLVAARGHSGALLPAAAAAATGVLVGAATVATRSVVDQSGPITLALLRYIIGVCCLLPPVLVAARVPFARQDLLPIGLLGIGQFGILVVLLNYALQSIPAARAALLFATMPLLTLLLGAALRLEAMTWAKATGVLLTVAGVGLAVGMEKTLQPGRAQTWTGEAAALGSALVGASCSLLYRPYLRRYPTLQLSAVAMLASVACLGVAAALGEDVFATGVRLTPTGWLAVAFIGASSGVGYYLWLWALGHTTPTRVTIFLALSPVTAAGLGALLLQEQPSGPALLGLVAVVLGLWLAHRPAPADE
jgi:drug/metabolite transporter (DMT)-like permease